MTAPRACPVCELVACECATAAFVGRFLPRDLALPLCLCARADDPGASSPTPTLTEAQCLEPCVPDHAAGRVVCSAGHRWSATIRGAGWALARTYTDAAAQIDAWRRRYGAVGA